MSVTPLAFVQPAALKVDFLTQDQLRDLIANLSTTKDREMRILRSYARFRRCELAAAAGGARKQADAFGLMARRAFTRLSPALRWQIAS